MQLYTKLFPKLEYQLSLSVLSSLALTRRHFEIYPPTFIVGAPRSGTTLTFKLLGSQSFVTALWEPHKLWSEAFGYYEDDTYASNITAWRLRKLRYSYYQKIDPNRPHLAVKDPRDSIRIETLSKIFPKARFLQVLRDGRDVVASIMKTSQIKLYQGTEGWPHVRIPGFKQMFNDAPHLNAARQWVYCVEEARKQLANVPSQNQLSFKYEDLLQNPDAEARKIFSFLYPQYEEESMTEVVQSISERVDRTIPLEQVAADANAATWQDRESWQGQMQKFSQSVLDDFGSGTMSNSHRVGKWKEELTPAIAEECYSIMKDSLDYWGYQ